MERTRFNKPRKLLPVRILAVLSIAAPLSLVPIGSEESARATAPPELVAFGQAGVSSAPGEWASRVLVEDFNGSGVSASTIANGYSSSIGTFRSNSSSQVVVLGMNQYGGAPCPDCSGDRTSKYAGIGGTGELTLTLSTQTNFKYVGFAWQAGSRSNTVCLMGPAGGPSGDACIALYSTTDLLNHPSFKTDYEGTANDIAWPYWPNLAHYGNPVGRTYSGTPGCSGVAGGGAVTNNAWEKYHCHEPFAFIHIFHDAGFARVKFTSPVDGGFEFDNVTASTAESWELIDLLPSGTLIGASTLPAYSVTSPTIIPVDPRSDRVSFPGVLLGGAAAAQANASLCVTEVNSAGTPVTASSSNLQITATVPASGVTSQYSAPRAVFSGAQSAIRDLSATIRINSSTTSRSVVGSESKYLRISVQARTGTGLTTCSGTNNVITAVIVELRPLRLNRTNTLGIPID